MKIDEIKAGTDYGLAQRRGTPRRVKAIHIVTVEEQWWDRLLERSKPRKVRRVEIEFLDEAPTNWDASKGSRIKVEARALIAPWRELGPGIQRAHAEKMAADNLREETEKRISRLLGRSYNGYVTIHGKEANLDVAGKSLARLLDYAEAGKVGKPRKAGRG